MDQEARSDIWRAERYANRAREIAYVTRGVGDYCGTAANDRSYRVNWTRETPADGATSIAGKVVMLNAGLLDGQRTPFAPMFVDRLAGIAAHEAGHITLARTAPYNAATDKLAHLVRNVVEDMAIDAEPMRQYNAAIGALTSQVREIMRPEQRTIAVKVMRECPAPMSAEMLARSWACGHLFGYADSIWAERWTDSPAERAAVAELDPIARRIMSDASSLVSSSIAIALDVATREIIGILARYEAARDTEPEQSRTRGDADSDADSEPDSGDEDGEQGDSAGDSGEDADSEDGQGSADDEDGEDAEDGDSGQGQGQGQGSEDGDGEDSDGDSNGDGDTDSAGNAPSKAPSKASKGGAGRGAGSPDDKIAESELDAPTVCANHEAGEVGEMSDMEWTDVDTEREALDAKRRGDGSRDAARTLAPYLDKRIVSAVRSTYERIASEPSKAHRLDTGRFDKRRIIAARMGADTVFTRNLERSTGGTLVLLVDLSGSMEGLAFPYRGRPITKDTPDAPCEIVKRVAASVYTALRPTPIACHVYHYSDGVERIAAPDKVVPFGDIGEFGDTYTGRAINAVVADVRPAGKSVLMVITDGDPTDTLAARDAIGVAQRAGWDVVFVNVGDDGDDECNRLADVAIRLDSFKDLPRVMTRIVTDITAGKRARMRANGR